MSLFDSRQLAQIRYLAEYLIIRVFLSLILAVSIETCQTVCRWIAWLACDVFRIRHQIVHDNLAIPFPDASERERQAIARRMWEHLLLMVCEIAHAPRKINETNWRKHIHVEQKRALMQSFLSRRPKVVVTAHFGNFEVGGFITGFWGFPSYTVARPLDNPYLDRLVNRFRESMGQIIIPKDDSAAFADKVLQTGGTLVLLGDQHAGTSGVWIEFMGRHASCHKALALFSLLNRAPMLVTYVKRLHKPMRFEVGLADAFDPAAPGGDDLAGVSELTQWYNDVLEEEIRQAPDQYWWLHNRWREAPPQRKGGKRKRLRRAIRRRQMDLQSLPEQGDQPDQRRGAA